MFKFSVDGKIWQTVAISVAVIVVALSAVMISINRAKTARAYAAAAASEEAAAEAKRNAATKEAATEQEKRRTAEATAKSQADELSAAKTAKEKAIIDERTAIEQRKAREAEMKTAKAKETEAIALRDAEKEKTKAARLAKERAIAEQNTAALKARESEDKLAAEKLKSEKIVAEAKIKELNKIDFETWQARLLELERDLKEREEALKPEKTIADLSWAGGMDDMVIDDKGNIQKQVKTKYLAEHDLTLPEATRKLAKSERLANEEYLTNIENVKSNIVTTLEQLYEHALREDRVVDADFYRKNLTSLYPEWKYKSKAERE